MNLKERLQLKAAREGEITFTLPISPGFDHIVLGRRKDYEQGHASTHEIIDKLAGALEKVNAHNKPVGFDGHKGPSDDKYKYWYKQEMLSREHAYEALQELEKWLVENVR